MVDVYSCVPVNKTASMVTNQSGCTSHEGLTLEQQKANLCKAWHSLEDKLLLLKKNDPLRKSYGKQIAELCQKIRVINTQIRHKRNSNVGEYIIHIVKSRMTEHQWKMLVEEANALMQKETKLKK